MKRTTRILSLLLVLCMLLSLVPVNALDTDAPQVQEEVPEAAEPAADKAADEFESTYGLAPQKTSEEQLPQDELAKFLAEHQPLNEADMNVTVEEIDNPGIDLTRENNGQPLEQNIIAPEETVRVMVVLEDKGLLDRGYTTAQISANGTKVVGELETIAQRQEAVLQSIQSVSEDAAVRYRYNVAVSGMSLEMPYGDLAKVREIPGVKTAFVAPTYEVPEDMTLHSVAADPHTNTTRDSFGSALTWNSLGYTGAGMRIAIIDTGLDLDHPSFAADPALTEDSLTLEEVSSVMQELNAYKLYSIYNTLSIAPERLYRSAKVPFAFNYCDENLRITHTGDKAGDHGTHVAGIAAANETEGTDVVGVAPDAQLLIMKVFGTSHTGAAFDDILAALEDAFRLNADAINMSLGTSAGFTNDGAEIAGTSEIFSKIQEHDVVVSISAGNAYSAAYANGYGTNKNLTQDPDNSVISSPGTYGGTVVASVENTHVMTNYFTAGGHKIAYTNNSAQPFTDMSGLTLEFVMIPGYGAPADFEGLDVIGKVAVISRGGIYDNDPSNPITFVDKQTNAYNAGARACIVYDNVDAAPMGMVDANLLPNVFISKADGAILAELAAKGDNTLVPAPKDDMIPAESYGGGVMSDFSSWGVAPDLTLMPDVTAPGGNIYATTDPDVTGSKYGLKSGTSMAAPHIAGMGALVLQYLRGNTACSEATRHTIAESLIMSTAEPVLESSGLPASPRKQGAGSANVYNAITSPVYLTVNGDKPKASLGDDDARTGVYHFSFQLNNLTDAAQTYTLDGTALTDQVDLTYESQGYTFMSETSRELDATVAFLLQEDVLPAPYDVNGDGTVDMADVQLFLDSVNGLSQLPADVKANLDLNGDKTLDTADVQILYTKYLQSLVTLETVTVPAGGTATVAVTVTLSAEDKAYMDRYYENGIYVDGFVRCYAKAEDGVDLSLPFMAFYGDWSDARMFDSGWYYEGNDAEYNRYPNTYLTMIGQSGFGLGLNPYVDEPYDEANNVLSPNSDGNLDLLSDVHLGLMRNAKKLCFTWTDENGNVLSDDAINYQRKSFYSTGNGMVMPAVMSWYVEPYDLKDANGKTLPNNSKLQLTINGYLDDGDEIVDETLTTPVIIDTEAPKIYTDEITLIHDATTDTRTVEFYVSDNYKVAAVFSLTEENVPITKQAVGTGEKTKITLDVTDYDASFVLAVCDYGCNETFYKVTFSGENNVDFDSFYGYRCFSTVVPDPSVYSYTQTTALNGWYSFTEDRANDMLWRVGASGQPDVHAAEYVGGYVIGVDVDGQIFAAKAGDWTRFPIGTLALDGVTYPAVDMAFDYTTKTLYVLTDELVANGGGHLVTVDYITGEVTDIGIVTGFENENTQALTLACDNEGVLYTIDYADGALYTMDKTTAKVSYVGETGYQPLFVQSMTVDHETDKLYWASYEGSQYTNEYKAQNNFYEVNKETGELTLLGALQHMGEIAGLFKPYVSDLSLFPENTQPETVWLSNNSLSLSVGFSESLRYYAAPYYAQMDGLTWASSDPQVATVRNGVVTAVGVGKATITATVGDRSAQCQVTVRSFEGISDMYLYSFPVSDWLSVNPASPAMASPVETAIETNIAFGFTAAAYMDGWIYACGRDGLYKLDPETLQGEKVGPTMAFTDMAVNYTDGFLYTLYIDEWTVTLYRVNPSNGDAKTVNRLSKPEFGVPAGGLAIDYDGNFYMISTTTDNQNVRLLKFQLDDIYGTPEAIAELPQWWPKGTHGSMLYLEEAGGIFCTTANGELIFIDPTDMNEPQVTKLGNISTSSGLYLSLTTNLKEEPELPEAEVSDVTLAQGSYGLMEGQTTEIKLNVTPWNAPMVEATYQVEDTSVATVTADGQLTAVSKGVTILTVTVPALDKVLTAEISVTESTGNLFGFLVSVNSMEAKIWSVLEDADASYIWGAYPSEHMITAGTYYDGYIYASGLYHGADREAYVYNKPHVMKIDPVDYSVEILKRSPYDLWDMAMDYTTGTLYGIVRGEGITCGVTQVDMETGEVTIIADTGKVLMAMAIDAAGQMYALGSDSYLYRVDKNTGELTSVGYTGRSVSPYYQSMMFDLDTGNLYWIGYGHVGLLDPETGKYSQLGSLAGGTAQMTALFTVPENEPAVPETVEPTGVNLKERDVVTAGHTLTLQAAVLPYSVSQVDQTLTWTSSDETVATVENGVVTGVAEGEAIITATTVNGFSAQCVIHVFDHERQLYAYDKTNTRWITFAPETPGQVTVVRDDKEGESVIAASAYTGETLYAFDTEGRFYTVDPETFERTKVSDAMYGKTMFFSDGELGGYGYTVKEEFTLRACDMDYDEATGKLYVVFVLDRADGTFISYARMIAEVDPATGELNILYKSGERHPGNILVNNGKGYFVDVFRNGMLYTMNLSSWYVNPTEIGLVNGYWCGGRTADIGTSLFRDPYTGTVYGIRDTSEGDIYEVDEDGKYVNPYDRDGKHSVIGTLELGTACYLPLGEIDSGIIVNSMFLK